MTRLLLALTLQLARSHTITLTPLLSTTINANQPDTPWSQPSTLSVTNSTQALVQFNLTRPYALFTAALELLVINSTAGTITAHSMLQPWNETSTWNSFGHDGVQPDGIEADTVSSFELVFHSPRRHFYICQDVTAEVNAWLEGETDNYGWVFTTESLRGWHLSILDAKLVLVSLSCFDIVLQNEGAKSWQDVYYYVLSSDNTVVVNRTMHQEGSSQYDEVCLPPGCYQLVVEMEAATAINWSLVNGTLSGNALSPTEFHISDDGEVAAGSCATAPTAASTATPTPSTAPPHFLSGSTFTSRSCTAAPSAVQASMPANTGITVPVPISPAIAQNVSSPSLPAQVPTAPPEASGNTTFEYLQAAIAAREAVIGVHNDITFESVLTLKKVHIKITGNGESALDGGTMTSLFNVQHTNLTLSDLTLQHGSGTEFGCLHATSSAILLYRTTFFNCNARSLNGGAMRLHFTQLRAVNSTFVSNKASLGACLRLVSSDVDAAACKFTQNSATMNGGVVHMSKKSTFSVTGTTFSKNRAEDGGVAYVFQTSAFSATDSFFDRNKARDDGGVAHLSETSSFSATSSSFTKNSASDDGGVAKVDKASTFSAINSFLSENRAGRVGSYGAVGGVASVNADSTFVTANSTFSKNAAIVQSGGVAYLTSKSSLYATNSSFVANAAKKSGGVAFVTVTSSFTASDSSFDGNTAETNGGVAFMTSTSSFIAADSSFHRNTAGTNAGVAYLTSTSSFAATNSSFDENDATAGSVLYMTSSSSLEWHTLALAHAKTPLGYTPSVRCQGSGTIVVAALEINAYQQHFDLDEACVLTFYQANNDGSESMKNKLRDNVISESGTINVVHWSYPCGQGRWSADGIEHGNNAAYSDVRGNTIDENDPTCDASSRCSLRDTCCSESCAVCPAGTYLPFSFDRYLRMGVRSCINCPVGRFLTDNGNTGKWWLHDELDDCAPCPPGRFANESGSNQCTACSPGTFSPDLGSLFCKAAQAGRFVPNKASAKEELCPPGRFAAGSSNIGCSDCPRGSYQPEPQQTSCRLSEPGFVVNASAAHEASKCPPGTYSGPGASECTPCDKGTFNNRWGEASCVRCPSPMTTSGRGARYCNACTKSYFWDTLHWTSIGNASLVNNKEQCVDCCVRCEDICDVDDSQSCVRCNTDGAVLETLYVKRGWWRATRESLTVYQCHWNGACRGGPSVITASQCDRGHVGALCGACDKQYDYDVGRNRCVRCRGAKKTLLRAGNLAIAMFFGCILLFFWWRRYGRRSHLAVAMLALKNHARGDINEGGELGILDKLTDAFYGGKKNTADNAKEAEEEAGGPECAGVSEESGAKESSATIERDDAPSVSAITCDESIGECVKTRETLGNRHALQRSFCQKLLTKLKIVVAAWQIAASTHTVLPQVHFPQLFASISKLMSMMGVTIFDFGTFDCLFGWGYLNKLAFVTLAPIVVAVVGAGMYGCVQSRRGKLKTAKGRRHFISNVTYATLLFVYVCIPSISSYVITYFSCARFDRGRRADLQVVAVQLNVKCTSKRYAAWSLYNACMILFWPVGLPFGIAVVLWRNRARLNPPVDAEGNGAVVDTDNLDPIETTAFLRERRRHATAILQLEKIKIRNEDQTISSLAFLFEEYEPRCYLFPVFELVRRIFLSSVVAVFFAGSMMQVAVAMLAAMVSFAVYTYYEAYIEDDDDVVSAVAQGQVVLTYFSAIVVYMADATDQQQRAFSGTAFGVFLAFVFCSSFLAALIVIVLDALGNEGVRESVSHVKYCVSERSTLLIDILREYSSGHLKSRPSLMSLESSQPEEIQAGNPAQPTEA